MKPKSFSLSSIFPNPFARVELEGMEDINRRIHEYALASEQAGKINRTTDDRSTTSWGPGFQLSLFEEKVPAVDELVGAVQAAVGHFLGQIGLGDLAKGAVRINGWMVLMRAGSYNAPHAHPYGTFSTIYHALVPEKPFPQGCLEFVNPIGTQAFHSFGLVTETVESKAGMLFIMPSYLVHSVHPFEGPGERISLNLDFFFEGGPTTALRKAPGKYRV
jgi:hypothetical protein